MMYSLFIRVAIDVQSKDLGFSSQYMVRPELSTSADWIHVGLRKCA